MPTAPQAGRHASHVCDLLFLEHDEPTHLENKRRLEKITEYLNQAGLLSRLHGLVARDATVDELAFVHRPAYIDQVRAASMGSVSWLDPDTYVGPRSFAAAVRAAGAVLTAVDSVTQGESENAFALVRPPGHHAVAARAMGFCLFNNVAIAARYASSRYQLRRVLIVDFDLHHGNGTQDAFYEESSVLYFSTHQYPYYPGTGHYQETGRGDGEGFTVNVPLPAGVGDEGYDRVFNEVLVPVARRYRPQLILASAGFDAHWADPLGMMLLSVSGYAAMTRTLLMLADELCAGRLVFTLEGGYNLNALAAGVGATFAGLLGDAQSADPLGPPSQAEQPVDGIIASVKRVHGL